MGLKGLPRTDTSVLRWLCKSRQGAFAKRTKARLSEMGRADVLSVVYVSNKWNSVILNI